MEYESIDRPVFKDCFICGSENPIGLHLDIKSGVDASICEWIAQKNYEGYEGILHGGIMASIFDDMMAHALYSRKINILTAHLEVDYRNPAHTGDRLLFEVHLDKHREGSKAYHMMGTVTRDDVLVAEAKGVVVSFDIN